MVNNKKLLNLIDHIDNTFLLYKKKFKDSSFETDWKIFSYVIKNHSNNKTTSITSIINYSNLPHATGIRRINKLIKNKKLYKKSKSKSGKSFSIHPSSKLIQDFELFLNDLYQSINFDDEVKKNYTETMPLVNSITSRYVLYPRIH
tara:strand:- start:606 stop:1043 length:438 start_codon:yes stop_codon:yes gene_type:complete